MYRNKKESLSKFWWDQRVFIVFQDLTVCGARVASAILLAVCAVKTVQKNCIIYVKSPVSYSEGPWFDQVSLCEICGAQNSTETRFTASISVFLSQSHSTSSIFIFICALLLSERPTCKFCDLPKSNVLSQIGGNTG
jgi:hypothetical protein